MKTGLIFREEKEKRVSEKEESDLARSLDIGLVGCTVTILNW